MKTASMRDIAAKVGVSVMTVSNVLNGRGKTTEETARHVLDTANALGFRKDIFASINASKRVKSGKLHLQVAFNAKSLVENDREPISFYRDIYFQLLRNFEAKGWTLHLTDYSDPASDSKLALADAIIEMNPPPPQAMKAINAPRVCAFFEMPGQMSVQPDNESAGRMAAELLLNECGYESVAICSHPSSFDQGARRDSFIKHCRNLNPASRIEEVSYKGPGDIGAGFAEVLKKRLEKGGRRPQALFVLCGSDTMLVHSVLSSMGISIPGEMGLLGFDDFPFYSWLPLKISRLYFATAEIASSIVEALEIAASGGAGDGLKMIAPIHYGAGESLACLQGRQRKIRH